MLQKEGLYQSQINLSCRQSEFSPGDTYQLTVSLRLICHLMQVPLLNACLRTLRLTLLRVLNYDRLIAISSTTV